MSATRLYLHIGRNKAGSTSLQDFCARNAGRLAAQGVSYVLLSHLATDAAGLPRLASHHDLIAFVRASAARAVFASNELFAALSPDLAATAARDLAKLDLTVLIYLRPYADWVRSSYSYDVRTGTNGRDFDAYLEHIRPLVSVWPNLHIWGEAVGWDRVRVRTTDAHDLHGGDLIADCLAAMDVALATGHLAERSNTRAHWMVVELLRLAAGRDQAPGWSMPTGLAIAQRLHELADRAIAENGLERDVVTYTTPTQATALRQLYNEDLHRIFQATDTRLTPDGTRPATERPFLPSAEHLPAVILSHIAERACRPEHARQHPELADFVRSETFTALLLPRPARTLAPPAGQSYLGKDLAAFGAAMDNALADTVRETPSAEEAFRLAEAGDLPGAIVVGARAARGQGSMELLGALARWRHDAFIGTAHPPGLPSWPPNLPDPFPGTHGVPSIDAGGLTAEILGGAILHHGALRVRGLVPHETTASLRQGIDRALAAQRCAESHEPTQDPGWFAPIEVADMEAARNWPHGPNAMYTADSPPMLQALIDALGNSGIIDRIAEFMGERPALSIAKSTLRRQTAVPISGWHQDGAFLGRQVRSVNVWLALSDCGTSAPSMDVIGRRLTYVVQTNSHGAIFDWSVGEGLVDILAEGGAPVQTPEFTAGDALLFDHLMLHRTSLKPGATGTRWAIESWFFAPTDYPYDRVPLYV